MTHGYGTFGFLNSSGLADEPLQLLDFGIERRQAEIYDFDNSCRDYEGYLFQYTLCGRGIYERNGKNHLLTPGCAFFAHIPESSRYYLPDQESGYCWEYFYVHFQGNAVTPFYRKIMDGFGPVVSLPADSFPVQLWLNLHKDISSGDRALRRYEGGELVYRFLASLLRTLEAPAGPVLSACVTNAIAYMKAHFSGHFSIEWLAAQNGLSSAHFTRVFTRETGQPPLSFLTDLRLSHALSLLLNTSLSVEDIAGACGFSCGNYFCKVFRKASGCSPAEYRRRYGG